MKYVAWFLVVVVLAAGGLIAYGYAGMRLQVADVKVQEANAAEMRDLYEEIRSDLLNQSFTGTAFREEAFLIPENYAFHTYTVRLRNAGILDAEWIRMEVRPDPSDILQVGDARGYTLQAGAEGNLSGTVLTRVGEQPAREIWVTYYVLGKEQAFQVEIP